MTSDEIADLPAARMVYIGWLSRQVFSNDEIAKQANECWLAIRHLDRGARHSCGPRLRIFTSWRILLQQDRAQ